MWYEEIEWYTYPWQRSVYDMEEMEWQKAAARYRAAWMKAHPWDRDIVHLALLERGRICDANLLNDLALVLEVGIPHLEMVMKP